PVPRPRTPRRAWLRARPRPGSRRAWPRRLSPRILYVRPARRAGPSGAHRARPSSSPDGGEPHAETCFEKSWPPHFVTLWVHRTERPQPRSDEPRPHQPYYLPVSVENDYAGSTLRGPTAFSCRWAGLRPPRPAWSRPRC